MTHPLSHMAAVVGGVAFIVWAGCGAILLADHGSNRSSLHSSYWRAIATVSTFVFVASAIGYFRPRSRLIYVPVLLTGVASFAIFAWTVWLHVFRANGLTQSVGILHSFVLLVGWFTWAWRTLVLIREERQAG